MRIYAKQAGDRKLEADAMEIRRRAELRLGELIAKQRESVGLNRGRAERGPRALSESAREVIERPTLFQMGIDQNLAERANNLYRWEQANPGAMEETIQDRRAEIMEEERPRRRQPSEPTRISWGEDFSKYVSAVGAIIVQKRSL
jgi:predicted NodU family carbamoyl transferase